MTEEQTTEDVGQQRTLNFAWGDHVVCYRPGRWVFALLLGVPLALAGAAAVSYTYQEKFKASAWLEIKENAPYIIYKNQGQSRRFVGTQTQLISSPLVLGEVLNDPDVKDLAELKEARDSGVDPLDWIREGLSVEAAGQQSELYMISFTSHTKEVAALVANAVTKAYYSHWQQWDVRRTQRVVELLEKAREKHARDVERLRGDVRRMTKDALGVDPYAAPSESIVSVDPLAELQIQLTEAQVESQILDMEIEAFQEMIDDPEQKVKVPETMVAEAVKSHPDVQAIAAQIQEKTIDLDQIQKGAARSREDPLYMSLVEEIAKDQETLAAVQARLVERVRAEMTHTLEMRRRTQLEEMLLKRKGARRMAVLLSKRYEEEFRKKKRYSGETAELVFQRAELARAEEMLDMIATRAAVIRIEQKAPPRITPLQDAVVPGSPVEGFPLWRITWAALAGLFLPSVLLMIWRTAAWLGCRRRNRTSPQAA